MNGDESAERQAHLQSLGFTIPEYLPEPHAPAVNWEELRALARRELPEEQARRACEQIACFRSWSDAFSEVLREEHDQDTGSTLQEGEFAMDSENDDREADLRGYLAMEYTELLDVMAGSMPSVRSNPLASYVVPLRRVICQGLQWKTRRTDDAYRDPLLLALAVTDVLAASDLRFPFPVTLAAATIVKYGLDRLCAGE